MFLPVNDYTEIHEREQRNGPLSGKQGGYILNFGRFW